MIRIRVIVLNVYRYFRTSEFGNLALIDRKELLSFDPTGFGTQRVVVTNRVIS